MARTPHQLDYATPSARPHTRRGAWLSFGVGAAVGLGATVTYVLAGGSTFWSVPLWALIAFYPGFVVGTFAHFHLGADYPVDVAVGCLTVSLCYGLIAWLGYLAVLGIRAVLRRRWTPRAGGW